MYGRNAGETITRIEGLLAIEERYDFINGVADILERQAARNAIRIQITSIATLIRSLEKRLERLPPLPSIETVKLAQTLLAFDNLGFLVLDADGFGVDDDLVRILLIDRTELVHFDCVIAQEHASSQQAMHVPGATPDLQHAPSLVLAWPSFLAALEGRYIVAYNLQFARLQLEKNAGEFDLECPVIVGSCLMKLCLQYFEAIGYSGLATLCEYIGHPLPAYPDQTAMDRAIGQLRLLQAMSQGISAARRTHPAHKLHNAGDEEDPC
jgi:hypothetical protein